MSQSNRPLILANGQAYAKDVTKKSAGGPPQFPRTYDQARSLVVQEISKSLETFADLPSRKRFDDELTLCIRLHPDMTAKSYDPKHIIESVPNLQNVGSRNYRSPVSEVAQTERVQKRLKKDEALTEILGRMVFVRGNPAAFKQLLAVLEGTESGLTDNFKNDIRRIEHFDVLRGNEQILGFEPTWKEGRVEIVLHPSKHSPSEQTDFFQALLEGVDFGEMKPNIASYPNGPTFISCRLNEQIRDALAGANPLRSVHPLDFGGFEELRVMASLPMPLPSRATTKSTIKVGMFDGGVDVHHPLLQGHVEEDTSLSIKSLAVPKGIAHGTAVAGILLHGPLNDKDSKFVLPAPPVSVVSFRVFPTSDPKDFDLFESIDVIEAVVPSRTDISTYNVSLGPRGPILDDTVSRFTYALDLLAIRHDVTFVVAVGNDGELNGGEARVQAPADMANGLGVGAFTKRDGKIMHAPYSCKGPGREGAKNKPDVVAFGGCEHNPIHLISVAGMGKTLSCGTSFSAPSTTSLVAQSSAGFERATPLLARSLVIHTAEHPNGTPDHLLGHGCIQPNLDSMLRCQAGKVTVLFQGEINPTKFVKLPVMLPETFVSLGNVEVAWTVGALPEVSPNHPSDYTSCCIESTFYPDSLNYRWSNPDKSAGSKPKILRYGDDHKEIDELEELGWTRSEFPVSGSGNQYKSEEEARLDCKWEPIVRHQISKRAKGIHNPFLVLHAIGRNSFLAPMRYVAIVTISTPKNDDLYDAIRRRYPALAPIRVRTQNEIRIKI